MIGLLKRTHRKVPKVTTLATFGFSSLFLSLLPGSLNLYRSWAVRSYDNSIATIVKTSTLFIWRNLFLCYCFLNKYSKELFDYGVDIHRRKEDFLNIKKMYCRVRFELHRENVKDHYTRQFCKACCNSTMIFVISSKKGNHFFNLKSLLSEGPYFWHHL